MILDDVTFDVVYPDLGVKHGVKVEKHLAGQHDQSSHGDWAHGGANNETDYQMSHRPPEPEDGAPAYDLTGNGNIYPKDVYDSDGARIYGHGGSNRAEDKKIHDLLVSIRNKPDAHVTIYRAVPKGVTKVNAGDWVTISEEYAKLHGESSVTARFGDYDILHTTVHANEIYTDGNSLYEWSYYPQAVQKHLSGQHDQATHGNWAGHHGHAVDRKNTAEGNPYPHPVQTAYDKVVAGEEGIVSPIDAPAWLDAMADRKDNPDLTNLEILGTQYFTRDNLGIMRDKMPQIPAGTQNDFIKAMQDRGVKVEMVDVAPFGLHPIQAEISASKSGKIMRSMEKDGVGDTPITISKDDYVIDGHHRWAAALFLGLKPKHKNVKMKALKVDLPHDELIKVVLAWNKTVGIKPIALGESNKENMKKMLAFDIAVLRAKIKSTEVEKHLQGQHDQSTHGRRFNSHVAPEVVHDVLSQVAENGGLSIKLTDGSLPPDGYMVSRNSDKFGTVVMASDFFNEDKGAKILGAFLVKNKAELGSGRAYLGVWHETTKTVNGVTVEIPKDQQRVHLDVTDKIVDKKQAISLGRRRNQISIWDVVNFDEIQTGGTGGTVEKRNNQHRSVAEAVKRDDGRGNYDLGGTDLQEVAKTSVIVKVPVNSFFFKHFAGQHDQSSHGNWAHGHSTDRPYELDFSGRKKSFSSIPAMSYEEDVANSFGPIARILQTDSTSWVGTPVSTAEFYYAVLALKNSSKSSENFSGLDAIKKLTKTIFNDPNYPQIPKKFMDTAIANTWWAKQIIEQNKEFSDSNIDELRRKAINVWAEQDFQSARAYLVAENKFVQNKIRQIKFPSGQTVGEVIDGVAQSLLDQMQEIANNNDVSLTMSTGKLKKFITEDHYRTASETTLSGKGATRQKYMERRNEFEFDIMGIPSETPNDKRPVYGVIGRSSKESTYGDAQVIFKDSVKHRTTATIGDSLDGFLNGTHWLEDYANGKVSVNDLWDTHFGLLINTFNNSNRSGKTYNWKNSISTGKPEWGGITGYSGKADLREIATYGYVETQIHGGLSLDDVATIVIPKSTSLTKATKEMLAGKGIEVVVGEHIEKGYYV